MHVALGVEYDGSAFNGYQQQSHVPSIQQALQDALSRVANEPVKLAAAGRTDSGVHATGQVVSFSTTVERPLKAWVKGSNALMPAAVKVQWAQPVPEQFHPRFDATARRYMYLFYEADEHSPLLDGHATFTGGLNDAAMHRAARALLGEQDFSAFRASGCQSKTPVRRVHSISVHRSASLVIVDITANAFLLHMVRNIAGALWQIGRNRQQTDWIARLLSSGDRALAAATAPPQGLYLVAVSYPQQNFPAPQLPGLLRSLGGLQRF